MPGGKVRGARIVIRPGVLGLCALSLYTYLIAYREAGARLDKLAFATDPGFMPMGLGQ